MRKRVVRLFVVLILMTMITITDVPVLPAATIKAEAASRLWSPIVTESSGTYLDMVKVTITNRNEKGKLYYTTNGKTPTAKSKQYKKPLTFRKNTTLKVICIYGSQKSYIVIRKYVVKKLTGGFPPMDESKDTTSSHVSKYINALACEDLGSLNLTDLTICWTIQDILEEQISSTMTREEKAKAIHDYLIHQTVYDYDNYLAGTIPDASYKVEGVLLNHTAVCNGYAETYYLFMHLLGIPCKFIHGVNHVWNLVKLSDGCWYHVDCTWDDPVTSDGSNKIQYRYLFADDSMMEAEEKAAHQWAEEKYPACDGTEYLYYGYRDCILSSVKEVAAAVRQAVLEGKTEVTVLYPKTELLDWSLIDWDAIYQAAGISMDDEGEDERFISYREDEIGNYTIFTLKWKIME